MKVLLLSAVLGLLYAGLGEAQLLLVPFSGAWKTHYLAASNKDIITEGGPFHIYLRHVQFHPNDTVDIDFYVKANDKGEKQKSLPSRTGLFQELTPRSVWWGVVSLIRHSTDSDLVDALEPASSNDTAHTSESLYSTKEKPLQQEASVPLMESGPRVQTSKGDKTSDRRYQKFKKETTDRGIPEENIVNFIDNDDCPEE
ncbi:odorant-binding protein-like [Dama dama]